MYHICMKEIQNSVSPEILSQAVDRFVGYAKIWTTSDGESTSSPSTARQLELSKILSSDLKVLGAKEIFEKNGNLVAKFSSRGPCSNVPPLVLCAHMDTAAECSGKGVLPQHIYEYDGSSIHLKNDVVIDPKDSKELLRYVGTHIITGDGTTLLGSDDKAGLAAICTVMQILESQNIPHGPIEVVFNTDEEIARGIADVPLEHIEARCGLTVDGQEMGLYEYENFNAVTAHFHIHGVAVHPGSAKNKMVNAIQLVNTLMSLLPGNEFPEASEGKDGFFCPVHIDGTMTDLTLTLLVRDFSEENMYIRIERLKTIAKAVENSFPGVRIECSFEWSYRNMRATLEKHPELLEIVKEAIEKAGVTPHNTPIRGGTDGAHFAEKGIGLVNMFTGGHELHGPKEWLSVAAFEKSIASTVNVVSLWAKKHS